MEVSREQLQTAWDSLEQLGTGIFPGPLHPLTLLGREGFALAVADCLQS